MLDSSGDNGPPCGVPSVRPVVTPSTINPACRLRRINRKTRLSPTLRATRAISTSWLTRSRKQRQTTHRRDTPDSVTIIRERHALEGRSLAVISSIRRGGVLLLLVSLPDGSRSLIPATWTDWGEGGVCGASPDGPSARPDGSAMTGLGRLEGLLQDRVPRRGVAERCPASSPALAGVWSAGHVGEADSGIIAGLGDALKGHVAGSLNGPFVVLLEQQGADEPGATPCGRPHGDPG